MKMFMYSLDGDAREWYFSLPPSSISSLKDFHTVFHKHCKRYFSAEFLFDNCCEEYELHNETRDIDREEIVSHNIHQFSNDLQDDVSSHKHEPEMDNEEAMVLEFVKDEEETFSTYVVKEEFHNHYDSQVVVLSHVENNFNDEINGHSLECFHYASNSLEDHQNAHFVNDPYEDQSFVQQIAGNIFFVEDQPCNEEKDELLASSF